MHETNGESSGDSETLLDRLQADAFRYLWTQANPANGLVRDSTWDDAPASIAAVGFTLGAYPVGVERGFITRAQARERTLATLRFFWHSPQSTAPDATGYKGFYYHFLHMQTGRRAWQCELSTIDTACLLAGALVAAAYFDQDSADEREIRRLADALYRRVDWQWALNGGRTVTQAGRPSQAFSPIVGKAIARAYCSTCWHSARRPRPYRQRATTRLRRHMIGKTSTGMGWSMPGHSLFITSSICFLTCV